MKIIKSFKTLKYRINHIKKIGFVPTMGSLHNGHLSLIKKAKKKSQKVLVSIFVNPSQFNERKDFIKYPRNIKNDISKLEKLKVDYVFLPNNNEIYQRGIKRKINIQKKDEILCAKYRKGHFQGVLAVMDRYLENIPAKYVFLGEKDYQQFFLIKKYLHKKYSCKIISCKTIRNKNRLPLSSRNINLSKINLKNSEKISQLIFNFRNVIFKEFRKISLINKYRTKIKFLCDNLEYFEIRNPKNLSKKISKKNFRIFIAYRQNNIRLIDNI
tara:strand:- start:1622 stop:2431 length:810 start_codon:yes stop_codon:yes gene_type:complete